MCPLCDSLKTRRYLTDFKKNEYHLCKDCGFVFQENPPEVKYNTTGWTAVTDPDGQKRDLTKERDFKIKNWYGGVITALKSLTPGKVLDIGCGLGYLLSALPSGWEKYGFDTSDFAREFIKNNFPDINLIEDLGLDRASPPEGQKNIYDVVVCYHVIEHIQDPGLFIKNIAMLLKPKGTLIIGTPNIESLAARMFKGNFRLLGEGHISLFNAKNLTDLIERNNLRIYKREFPFFKTDYFRLSSLIRMLDPTKISPPFYGSIMTFYAQKN